MKWLINWFFQLPQQRKSRVRTLQQSSQSPYRSPAVVAVEPGDIPFYADGRWQWAGCQACQSFALKEKKL